MVTLRECAAGESHRRGAFLHPVEGKGDNEKENVERMTAKELETPQEVLARMRAQIFAALEI